MIVPRTTPSHHSRENKPIFSDAIASAYVAYVITSQINKIHCPFNQFRRSIDRSNRNKQLCSCNKIEIKNKSKTHWSNSCQFQTKQINKKAQETQKRTEILWHFCDIQKIYLPCRKKNTFETLLFFLFVSNANSSETLLCNIDLYQQKWTNSYTKTLTRWKKVKTWTFPWSIPFVLDTWANEVTQLRCKIAQIKPG